jgi:hypothetical protein
MHDSQRPLREILRIEDQDVVAEDVEVIEQGYEVALAFFDCAFRSYLGHENRFLERRCGACPIRIFPACIPLIVAKNIEQAASGRAAFRKVVGFFGVDVALPEVVVLVC